MEQATAAARRPTTGPPPAPAAHKHTRTIHNRPESLPRRALVSIIGGTAANLLTASLVGLIPTIPPFPTAARETYSNTTIGDKNNGMNGDGTDSGVASGTCGAAGQTAPGTSPKKRSTEEQRRILHLEQSIRTRALIDDMVNSLE